MTSTSRSPSKSPSASPSAGAYPWYYRSFTSDPTQIATFESTNILVNDIPVNVTLRLQQSVIIYTASAKDTTFPTRTDKSYPDDTDQYKTLDDTPDDYSLYLQYAYGLALNPTEFFDYTQSVNINCKYIKVRSIVVCNAVTPGAPIGLTKLRVAIDLPDIVFDIKRYTMVNIEGDTIAYSTYGYHFNVIPSIQATLVNSVVSLVPVITSVSTTTFFLQLKDIAGNNRTGTVNIHVHGC